MNSSMIGSWVFKNGGVMHFQYGLVNFLILWHVHYAVQKILKEIDTASLKLKYNLLLYVE